MTHDIQKPTMPTENSTAMSPETFISQAIAANVPVETMERLLAMRDKIKAEQAKEAFNYALAGFQGECPTIEKKKEAKDGSKVLYTYAPLDSIVTQVRSLLQKYGLSYAIKTDTVDGNVQATCFVRHKLGHEESSTATMPLATKTGIMSNAQQVAATMTFAKRYAFCNAFGIMTGDEDSESALQKDEVVDAAMGDYEAKLRSAKTLDELKSVWGDLPALAKKNLAAVATELKGSLQ